MPYTETTSIYDVIAQKVIQKKLDEHSEVSWQELAEGKVDILILDTITEASYLEKNSLGIVGFTQEKVKEQTLAAQQEVYRLLSYLWLRN